MLPFGASLKKFVFRNYSLLVSLEDHALHVTPFVNIPGGVTNILIVRDPYSMLASRIRKAASTNNQAFPRVPGPMLDRIVDVWKMHAREFLGLTNTLKRKVCVNFDSWFSNQAYRKHISRQLNMPFTDEGFSTVSNHAGGSSFDRTNFNRNNQAMDVLDRQKYLSLSERRLLDVAVADDALQELARRIKAVTQKAA